MATELQCAAMSSARSNETDNEATSEWRELKSRWRDERATKRVKHEVLLQLKKRHSLRIDQIYVIAERILPGLTLAYPRCIHEKQTGEGYRAEWQHWVASAMQALRRQGLVEYDDVRELWVIA